MTGRGEHSDPLDRIAVTPPLRIAGIPPGVIDAADFDVTDEVLGAYPALVEIARAARDCAYLEYDPARHEEINQELGRRANVLREALARLDSQ